MAVKAGRAAVEVVADLSTFAKQLVRDLNAAMRGVRLNVDPVSKQLTAGIQEGVDQAATIIESLGDDAKSSLGEVGAQAGKAGRKLGDEVAAGGDQARESLRGVGAQAGKTGRKLGEEIGAGSDRARESLRGVGDQAQRSSRDVGEAFSGAQARLALAGAAAGAAFTGALAMTLDKSRIDAVVAAQLGAGPQEAARIGRVAGEVFTAGFGADLPQIGSAIRAAAQAGLTDMTTDTDATVKQVTQRLLTVGTILEEDTSRVATAVSQMLRTGLAGSADEAMDLLVAATQRGVNKSEDLLDTMNEYGTQFRQIGLNGPQALGLLSQAINAGARDADTAADALKEFAIRAIDSSKTSADAFKLLGLDAEKMTALISLGGQHASDGLALVLDRLRDMKNPVDQNAAAVGLFGTKAEDLGKALFAMDLDTAAQEMEGLAGATDRAANTIGESAGAKLDRFRRAVQVALIDKIVQAGEVVAANQTEFKALGVVIGGIAVTIGTVTVATKAWTAAQTIATVATKAWTVANRALTASWVFTPIGAAIALIVALVAVFVIAYQRSETFRSVVDTALRAVGDAAMWLWHSAIQPAFTAIAAAAMWLWQTVLLPAFNGISAAVRVVAAAISWWWTNVTQPVFTAIGTIVMWLWSNVFSPAMMGIGLLIRTAGAVIGWLWSVVQPPVTAIGGLIFWLWQTVISVAINRAIAVLRGFGMIVSWLWSNAVSPAMRAIGTIITWLWQSKVSPAFNAIASIVRSRIEAVVATARRIGAFVSQASAGFTSLVNAARGRLEALVALVRGVPGRIRSALGNLGRLLYNAGSNVISGLINGIMSRLSSLRATVSSVASTIRNALPFSPARWGPLSGSGDPTIAGGKIVAMLSEGMDRESGRLRQAVASMAQAARPALDVHGRGELAALGAGTLPRPMPAGGGQTSITFGPGSIVIEITGPVTEEQARRAGEVAGDAIAQTLAARDLRAQIRSM